MKQVLFFCSLSTLFFLYSCSGTGSNGLQPNQLVGTWVCIDGTMDGEKAELLIKSEATKNEGAKIEFSETIMTFELLGDPSVGKSAQQPYSIQGDKIVCTNDKDLSFEILKKEDNQLSLRFLLLGRTFELKLERL